MGTPSAFKIAGTDSAPANSLPFIKIMEKYTKQRFSFVKCLLAQGIISLQYPFNYIKP